MNAFIQKYISGKQKAHAMNVTKDRIKNGRRRLFYWAAGMLSTLVFWRFYKKVKKENEPVRMLTEDGQLVEVDPRYFSGKGRKIKANEIHTWIKRKK